MYESYAAIEILQVVDIVTEARILNNNIFVNEYIVSGGHDNCIMILLESKII